ncbi:M24 family metallopeptidase [Agrobacterium vitis]|uniref:M24 family metallopeptidase n=1 Tax=Agrobacterium vitis TaxID=373 RepID=UPI0012E90F2E|nr:Xaa-Pro peptidase family protein [Agrobacterium vitis]MVA60032.1 M24 family metallopeptidase [Agrobacterium vitis]
MSSPLSAPKISMEERVLRLETLRKTMAEKDVGAVLIGSTESLRYFTGLVWHGSERLVGAVITQAELVYVVPGFERSRVETLPHLPGDIRVWEEDESSAALVASFLPHASTLAVDDSVPLFVYNALKREITADRLIDGGPLLRGQRLRKSATEIAIIQYAMNLTLDVQRKAHAMIRPGIAASEVVRFIDDEHRRLGASNGSTFCIVSFGETTSLPHGADGEQYYQPGDVVLVDTGCHIDGYNSDITRTYMLEEPTAEFVRIWEIERAAQQAVFDAARIGATCGSLDDAARDVLTRHGLGPDYQLPGLPHRAGHGLGLEGHEEPYIVRGNTVRLEAGMCFSCEPMIVLPGQFGLRLEDIIYMTSDGPNWFTHPAKGPTEPFSG